MFVAIFLVPQTHLAFHKAAAASLHVSNNYLEGWPQTHHLGNENSCFSATFIAVVLTSFSVSMDIAFILFLGENGGRNLRCMIIQLLIFLIFSQLLSSCHIENFFLYLSDNNVMKSDNLVAWQRCIRAVHALPSDQCIK